MEYLTLDEIKKHLNIDPWFTEDDEYLMTLEEASRAAVENHLDLTYQDLEYDYGVVPRSVLQAQLLMIGNLYNNREANSILTVKEVPLAYQYLLQQFKNYDFI